MGGGACEATVFHRAGFPTGALCVAMQDYHNMGPGDGLRCESISLRDWQGLYDFLYFLATEAQTGRRHRPRGDAAAGRAGGEGAAMLGKVSRASTRPALSH